MIQKFGILISLITLFNCSSTENYVAYNDAQAGLNLDRAKSTSVKSFFASRMLDDSENPNSPKWVIVKEDSSYVYYGQLAQKNGNISLNPFYKTNKTELENKFPTYADVTGKHIKAKAYQHFIKPIIQENLTNQCPTAYSIEYNKKNYTLTNNGIKVDFDFEGKCYEKSVFKANTNGYLTADNLDVFVENILINK